MFYAQYELDKFIQNNFFKDKKNGFFVECGAFDGLSECTCKFFEESMGWKGLNIEPVPYAYNKLVINRPNSINENYALSNNNGTAIFTNAIHPGLGRNFGNGSLSHAKIHMDDLISQGCSFETFEVQTIRFEELHKKHSLPEIDLFVLDVEGAETEALAGIITMPVSVLPKIFCIEDTISDPKVIFDMMSKTHSFYGRHANNAFYIKNN